MTLPESFTALPAPISAALARRGFETLTPVQEAVVAAFAEGRDLRISSQTGSGKTVAIGLALASHFLDESSGRADEAASRSASTASVVGEAGSTEPPSGPARGVRPPSGPRSERGGPARPSALVIVPTRELAAQVRQELGWLYADVPAMSVEVVTGGTSIVMEERALRRGPSLVVGTPGRLLDHLNRGSLDCALVRHVVLDEADQMLDMGFRDELDAILAQLPEERSSHLVSATFPRAVRALADAFQKDALTIEGTRPGAAHSDILHIAHAIRRDETYAALVNVLLLAGDTRCLLFVARRADASSLAERLVNDGFVAAPLSGELPQAQRTRTLAAFRSGACPILVSTDVAARGIDVPDIEAVIHVDPPRNAEAYVHRSGRTGRAGSKGRSILLVLAPELRRVERMLRSGRIEVSWQPVPTPEKVRKAIAKRSRRELHARLAAATPSEQRMLEAKELLEERDPVAVVAALLETASPAAAREPLPVVGVDPFVDDRPKRGRPMRPGPRFDGRKAPGSGGRTRAAEASPRGRPAPARDRALESESGGARPPRAPRGVGKPRGPHGGHAGPRKAAVARGPMDRKAGSVRGGKPERKTASPRREPTDRKAASPPRGRTPKTSARSAGPPSGPRAARPIPPRGPAGRPPRGPSTGKSSKRGPAR
ncbi:MAG: DEAD/DEAH box helicase [Myxococcota bacterium]